MRLHRSFFLRVCLLFLACLLAGCSALRLGYNNGESVAYWWLNSYVDLDDSQQPLAKRHIGDMFAWHRQTQLNDYALALSQTRHRLQGPVTQADVATEYEALKKRMLPTIDTALPGLAELAMSLHPPQIAQLEKKFAANNEKYRNEYLRGDLEHRQHHRYQKVMKHAEYWFGSFSSEQEARIRALSDARPLDNELWLSERIRRQQELIALLKRIHAERPARESVMRMIRDYAIASLDGNPRHASFIDASRNGLMRMVADILNLATADQKTHAENRLQKWADDFHGMARKAQAAAASQPSSSRLSGR
jgi:hypothetical protein